MESSLFSKKDYVKYFIIGGLVYYILKKVPAQQLSNRDMILILSVIILGFVSIDCMFSKNKEGFANETNDATKSSAQAAQAGINSIIAEITQPAPTTSCAVEVTKVKRELEDEINLLKSQLQSKEVSVSTSDSNQIAARYFESLMTDLNEKGLLDASDIENIKVKLRSRLLSMEEVINSLETLKKEGKPRQTDKSKDDRKYTELPYKKALNWMKKTPTQCLVELHSIHREKTS